MSNFVHEPSPCHPVTQITINTHNFTLIQYCCKLAASSGANAKSTIEYGLEVAMAATVRDSFVHHLLIPMVVRLH